MGIAFTRKARTSKPHEHVRLGDWQRLFSRRPHEIYLHQNDGVNIYETVNGRHLVNRGLVGNNGAMVETPFGAGLDTQGLVSWQSTLNYTAGLTVITFVRYNNNTQNHRLFSCTNEDPAGSALFTGSTLRAFASAGNTPVVPTDNLTNTVAGYLGYAGWHCYGIAIESGTSNSFIAVNGVVSALTNPGVYANSANSIEYYDSQTIAAVTNSVHVWTMSFEGLLGSAELAHITQNPEAIYSILQDKRIARWIAPPEPTIVQLIPAQLRVLTLNVIVGQLESGLPPPPPPPADSGLDTVYFTGVIAALEDQTEDYAKVKSLHCAVEISGKILQFSGSTAAVAPDTTPAQFSFTDIGEASLSTLYQSNTISVTGINTASPISITGGEYKVNSGTWGSITAYVGNGDLVQIRATSSAQYSTAVNATLNIGGVSDTMTVSTFAQDTVPNQFTFTDETNAQISTLSVSNQVTITGINSASVISVVGGEYQINTGAYTAVSGTVLSGDLVRVRANSSASFSTAINVTLTVGGIFDTYTITTRASDSIPDQFTFTGVTNAQISTLYQSNAITITGINAAATASVVGGEYRINAGTWGTVSASVLAGNTIDVRRSSSSAYSTSVSATLTVGSISDTFSIATEAFALSALTDINATSNTYTTASAVGTAVGISLYATRPGYTPTFDLTDSAGGIVSVNANTGVVSVGLIAATAGTYTITGRATAGTQTVTANFSVTVTAASDTTPNQFTFIDVPAAVLSTLYTSNTITLSGMNAQSSAAIVGGEYQVNGGAWITTVATVVNGDTLAVRATSSQYNSAITNVTLYVGGISDTYSISTVAAYTATLWVNAATGNDNNTIATVRAGNGAGNTPWATIGRALWGSTNPNATVPSQAAGNGGVGDVLSIAAGNYVQTGGLLLDGTNGSPRTTPLLRPINNGTITNPIVISAVGTVTIYTPDCYQPAMGVSNNSDIKFLGDFQLNEANLSSFWAESGPMAIWGGTRIEINGPTIIGLDTRTTQTAIVLTALTLVSGTTYSYPVPANKKITAMYVNAPSVGINNSRRYRQENKTTPASGEFGMLNSGTLIYINLETALANVTSITAGLYTNNHAGIYMENADSCEIRYTSISNFIDDGENSSGMETYSAKHTIVEHCNMSNCVNGIFFKGQKVLNMDDNRVRLNRITACTQGIHNGYLGTAGTNDPDVTYDVSWITQNIFKDCTGSAVDFKTYDGISPRLAGFANNLVINCGNASGNEGGAYVVWSDVFGAEINNNIVIASRAALNRVGYSGAQIATNLQLNLANNTYFNMTDVSTAYYFNRVPYTAAAWDTLSGGKDSTGRLTSDPLFVDFAGGNYRLQAGSPCIGSGVDVANIQGNGTSATINRGCYITGNEVIGRS